MEFENNGLKRCVVLKSNNRYSLIYSISFKEFVVAVNLDKTGNWEHGYYYGQNLDNALLSFNEKTKEIVYER